jgi:hypothetical protein
MIVATLIMGIAVVGTLAALQTSLRGSARLMERDRAVLLGRSKMNELLADRRAASGMVLNGSFDPRVSGGNQAGWQARVSIFDHPEHFGPGTTVLDRVDLEIWWISAGQRRTYPLHAYRRRVATMDDVSAGQAVAQ